METKNDILNELNELSPLLAEMEKLNVYTVPEGYFEGLSTLIQMGIQESGEGVLNSISRQHTASVPSGYFENLADTIMNRIKEEEAETALVELKALSPLLYAIQDANVYEVPDGYFNGFAGQIINMVKPSRSGLRVISRTSAVFMRYAVAAAFTGVMALGIFKFTSSNIANNHGSAWTMNVDKELDKVADDDMIKYLETNSENVDAVTVASKTLNENELPSQADYLNDDKALDNYLENINSGDLKN